MKFARILVSAFFTGAVLISSTACSSPTVEPAATAQAKIVDEKIVNRTPASGKNAEVARTVSDFYIYASAPSNLAKIEEASAPIKGHGKKVTNEELDALVKALPAGFKYFDTSSPDRIKNAYIQLTMGARTLSRESAQLQVFDEAVSIDGDTATVRMVKTETIPSHKKPLIFLNSGMAELKLKKNDSGQWVMIAEALPGISTENGFASATMGSNSKK